MGEVFQRVIVRPNVAKIPIVESGNTYQIEAASITTIIWMKIRIAISTRASILVVERRRFKSTITILIIRTDEVLSFEFCFSIQIYLISVLISYHIISTIMTIIHFRCFSMIMYRSNCLESKFIVSINYQLIWRLFKRQFLHIFWVNKSIAVESGDFRVAVGGI